MTDLIVIKRRTNAEFYQALNLAKVISTKYDSLIIDSTTSTYFQNIAPDKLETINSIEELFQTPIIKLIKKMNLIRVSKSISEGQLNTLVDYFLEKKFKIILIVDELDNIWNTLKTNAVFYLNIIDLNTIVNEEIENIELIKNKVNELIAFYSFDIYNNSLQKLFIDFNNKFKNNIYENRILTSLKFDGSKPFIINQEYFDETLIKFYEKLIFRLGLDKFKEMYDN